MRIAFPFVGDSIGGSHISSLILIQELKRVGYDVTVLLHEEGPLALELSRENLPWQLAKIPGYVGKRASRAGTLSQLLKTLLPAVREIKKNRFDIIHTNDAKMHLTWTLPAQLAGVKHVWHQRTVFSGSRLSKLFIYRASALICISRYVERTLDRAVRGRASILPNPVKSMRPSQSIIAAKREKIFSRANVPLGGVVIGVFGNLIALKSPMTALHILVETQKVLIEKCVLVFLGEDREQYQDRLKREAAKYGIESSVVFMGFQRPVEPWLAACDVLLAPSTKEGFGRTLIEAMALGVPVVASNIGGHREIIVDLQTGILFDKEDAVSASKAIIQVLMDKTLSDRMTNRAKNEAFQKYAADQHMQSVQRIYKNLC